MSSRPDPPYARIAAGIRDQIESGSLRPGDRVPSTRQLTKDWNVAMATATKALAALRQDGLVRAVPGVGTVVAGQPAAARPVRVAARRTDRDLTLSRVVAAAVEVADREGIAALSMRRVAAELGVATMSLYRHVSTKDDLLLHMADVVFGEQPLPEPAPDGWRAMIEVSARVQWAIHRRHPWLAPALSVTRPQFARNLLPHTEWTLRALHGRGLDPSTMLYVAISVFTFVRGIAINLEYEAQAQDATGVTSDEWVETQQPAMQRILAGGDFPMFTELIAGDDFDLDLDRLFEIGLRWMLDGLAAQVR
ncbi:TetR family transcriptional regulator [Herbihabitans rhizosphaerae]|uniref:TetR family transcriptional regulator n=1 Tax=Herbihabitans rhizosphaerae TaxID=1872711 RepID=A0A4Q7KG45_9PSEU|nr:TetR/AcrR family transcriptional regulator C-terminal domain-containing protein [Herbihabitans rhizosphaerae]RZS32526.1 TetR family transcriptional regulator [Herbihabitans rhizosphaerae]